MVIELGQIPARGHFVRRTSPVARDLKEYRESHLGDRP